LKSSSIVKSCQQKIYQHGNTFCLYNDELIDEFLPQMLTGDYWQELNAIVGSAQGRGTTYFIKSPQGEWVLKHYYRGGLVGKFIRDSYLFTGCDNSRAVKEYKLLQSMQELMLPVPQPIACRVVKSGITYQADILTSRIEQANDLVAILTEREICSSLWQKIGACIQSFHRHGIYHHDLNAHNILMDDDQKVWVIDFDRGELRKPEQQWQQHNIERLKRSFHKEKAKHSHFYWGADDWDAFITGYLRG